MSRHHKKLSNSRWQAVRKRILHSAGFRCQKCGRPGRMEVHHLHELNRGDADPYDPTALVCWCVACHLAFHRKPLPPERAAWAALVQELANS